MKATKTSLRERIILVSAVALMGHFGHGMEIEGLEGTLLLDSRIRFETVTQSGLESSEALTGRLRLGYQTELLEGFELLVEGEGTATLDSGGYDAYPGAQGTAGKAVIADPQNLELNRLQIAWKGERAGIVAGRQRIIRNNARFIGNVGWRQNEQTYDAIALDYRPVEELNVYYSYLDRATRIFGQRADVEAQQEFDMQSHVLEVQYAPSTDLTAGIYAYLLGIENSPADASDTVGMWATGRTDLSEDSGLSLEWRAEIAQQFENNTSPDDVNFNLSYTHLTAGLKKSGLGSLTAGYEALEGNGMRGFSTPLATLHAHNGFADIYLSTPAGGLVDYYLKMSAPISDAVTASCIAHEFHAEKESLRYGRELDLVIGWKINKQLSVTSKLALYDGTTEASGAASANVSKFWLQLDARY